MFRKLAFFGFLLRRAYATGPGLTLETMNQNMRNVSSFILRDINEAPIGVDVMTFSLANETFMSRATLQLNQRCLRYDIVATKITALVFKRSYSNSPPTPLRALLTLPSPTLSPSDGIRRPR